MSIAQSMLPEFDHEMANTRKTLERVPDDKWDWKPHPKSGTMGWLANHIAFMPGWAVDTLTTDSFDFMPNGEMVEMPNSKNRAEVLAMFDKGVAATREALTNATDAQMMQHVVASTERPADLHDAACSRSPRPDLQPHNSPSRATLRLFPSQRHRGPRPLRPLRRRSRKRPSPPTRSFAARHPRVPSVIPNGRVSSQPDASAVSASAGAPRSPQFAQPRVLYLDFAAPQISP